MVKYKELLPYTFCNDAIVLELTATLCEQANIDGISGDFAEAGCAYGMHGVIMNEYKRKVHLFDSFQGIPKHGPEDKEFTQAHGESVAAPRISGGITVCNIIDVKNTMGKFMSDFSNIVFHPGWFADTFEELKDEKFAVLRLDCDVYESYKLCFKKLLPRVSKGGWIIIDDWVLSGCKKAFRELNLSVNPFLINHIAYFQWD